LLKILLYFIGKDSQSTVQEQTQSNRIREGGRHVANKKVKKVNFTLEQGMKAKSRSGTICLLFLLLRR